jgi:hypothetical protein
LILAELLSVVGTTLLCFVRHAIRLAGAVLDAAIFVFIVYVIYDYVSHGGKSTIVEIRLPRHDPDAHVPTPEDLAREWKALARKLWGRTPFAY